MVPLQIGREEITARLSFSLHRGVCRTWTMRVADWPEGEEGQGQAEDQRT